MNMCHRKCNSVEKRVLAVILIILSVTIFTAEANAFSFRYGPVGSNGNGQVNGPASERQTNVVSNDPLVDPPTAVPEPTTILLLASGLGMVFWKRRSKQA